MSRFPRRRSAGSAVADTLIVLAVLSASYAAVFASNLVWGRPFAVGVEALKAGRNGSVKAYQQLRQVSATLAADIAGLLEPTAPPPAPSAPPAPPLSPRDSEFLRSIDLLLELAEAQVREARFAEALITSTDASRRLEFVSEREAGGDGWRHVRLELIRAVCHIAYSEPDLARQALERALRADPELRLDPARTSPRLLAALEAAREDFASRAAAAQDPPTASVF